MKKINGIICAFVAAAMLIVSLSLCVSAEDKLVTGPIDITYDASKVFATTRLTGRQISEAMHLSGISHRG
ncbi:MAG: hypothetical protein IKX86_00585, partial [Clostridia bacterium]|nr:hypothetical protein [Clostridia bacterium]